MTTEKSVTVEFPKRWIFDEGDRGKDDWTDGRVIDGKFVRFEQGRTDFGLRPIAVIEVADAERSVWLLHDAIYNRFRDELQRRSMPKLIPGERIVIEKLAEKVKSKNDREYVAYRVFFPDAPQPDEEALFNLDPAPPAVEPEPEAAAEAGDVDDIPF